VWLMDFMHFNMSVAVAVGFIALAGVAAETGVVMLIYLDHALTERGARCASEGRAFTRADLRAAIMAGAVERVRPKMMTVTAIIAGLLPILWSHGTGSELMQRIAVPMIGGMVSSTVLTPPGKAPRAVAVKDAAANAAASLTERARCYPCPGGTAPQGVVRGYRPALFRLIIGGRSSSSARESIFRREP
jgi:hypothetical protein